MSPRTMADRLDRARQRAERRDTLHVLLARIDRLSPVEAALLVDYVRAELDASDHLRATIQGQQNAMQEASDRTRAAEAAIVEAEKDRDRAEAERDALAGGVPLVCSDERHKTKVFALETALATEKDISRRLLSQRQEMATERFAWQERGDRAEAAIATFAAIFRGFGNLLATSSRDWAEYRVDAWLWAVILGWDCEETEHNDTCIHGVMEEMADAFGWDEAAVAKARRYRATVRAALDEHQEQP